MNSSNLFQSVFYKSIFALAIVIYVVTAWNSHGYYHADEHYQIIEFAGEKLGTHGSTELAWEWRTKSRQAIQPFIAYLVFSALQFVGAHDAYFLAFVLRLLSMLLSLYAIHFFLKNTIERIRPNYFKIYVALSYFLWFLPVIYVRFSSETWSAAMLLFAFSFVLSDRIKARNTPFLIGCFLGFAFLFRYQSAFISLGLLVWLLAVYNETVLRFMKIISAGIFTVLIGVVIDSWYYNEWIFVPWRYLNYQVIQDVTSAFGVSDWHFYATEALLAPGWPIGVVFLASFIHLVIHNPKNLLVWALLPFIIVHSLIPHKEVRFFFVFVNLMPFIFVSSVQLIPTFELSRILRAPFKMVLVLFALLNLIGLAAMSLKSAGNGRQEISKYIHEKYVGKPVNLIYTSWASPYNPWHVTPAKFYEEPNVLEQRISSLCDLNDSLLEKGQTTLLVVRKAEFYHKDCAAKLTEFSHEKLTQSIPEWIEFLNTWYGQLDEKELLVLYEINGLSQPD